MVIKDRVVWSMCIQCIIDRAFIWSECYMGSLLIRVSCMQWRTRRNWSLTITFMVMSSCGRSLVCLIRSTATPVYRIATVRPMTRALFRFGSVGTRILTHSSCASLRLHSSVDWSRRPSREWAQHGIVRRRLHNRVSRVSHAILLWSFMVIAKSLSLCYFFFNNISTTRLYYSLQSVSNADVGLDMQSEYPDRSTCGLWKLMLTNFKNKQLLEGYSY